MPEIAEVEITRNAVNEVLPMRVERVSTTRHGDESVAQLHGSVVGKLGRVGKWLTAPVDDGEATLVAHLGMSGALLIDAAPKKHTHALLTGQGPDGSVHSIGYDDPRRFGKFIVYHGTFSPPVGPDLWSREASSQYLSERTRKTRRGVKTVLLDQSVIAGVGSYLVDEACFRAGVNPTRSSSTVSEEEWERVLRELVCVSKASYAAGGATFKDFRKPDGSSGEAANAFLVYGRGGLACSVCTNPLHSGVTGGRSVVYCSTCQT